MKTLAAAFVTALAALVGAGAAQATHGPPPWTGGIDVETAAERRIGVVASEIARRPGSGGICMSPTEWATLAAASDLDPARWDAAVPIIGGVSADFMIVAPHICTPLDEFLARPARVGQKACQTGTRIEYRTKYRTKRYRVTVRKRVKVGGTWRSKPVRVWRTRRVAVRVAVKVPVYAECAGYRATVYALQTIGHEATHIGGVYDEAAAECYGMQLTPLVANRFGATPTFSFEIGADYLPLYIEFTRGNAPYETPHCHDGGLLDLFPNETGWPTPRSSSALATPLRRLMSLRNPLVSADAFFGRLPK